MRFRALAAELERYPDLGPGLIHRVGSVFAAKLGLLLRRRPLQRQYFNAPPGRTGYGSRYR